jgi:hypothetical protein
MTTIVNTPPASSNSSGPVGMIILLAILLVTAYVGVVYGVPALQRIRMGNPQINVPSKIDINVHQTN